MRSLALSLVFMLVASQLGATSYTSTRSGNWSDSTMWSPAVVPAAGDTAQILTGHSVVADANVTIGTGSGTAVLVGGTTTGLATLTLGTNVVMTVSGNIQIGNGSSNKDGKLIFGAGSQLEIGSNNLYINNCYLASTSTSDNWAKVTGTGGIVTKSVSLCKKDVTLQYVSFQNTGLYRFELENSTGYGAMTTKFDIDNCAFVGGGTVTIGSSGCPASASITIDHCDFVDTSNITLAAAGGTITGTRRVHGCVFSSASASTCKTIAFSGANSWTFDSNVLSYFNLMAASTSGLDTISNNLFYAAGQSSGNGMWSRPNAYGPWTYSGNYVYQGGINCHTFSSSGATSTGGDHQIYDNFVEVVNTGDTADLLITGNKGVNAHNNIFALNSGFFILSGVTPTDPSTFKNNTVLTDGFYMTELGESDSGTRIASNLGVNPGGGEFATYLRSYTGGTTDQHVAYSGYNDFYDYNGLIATQHASKTIVLDSEVGDMDVDPAFKDSARRMATWNQLYGSGTNTPAAAATYFIGLNGYSASTKTQSATPITHTYAEMLAWVRDGFHTTNTALKAAGDPADGSPDIGAMSVVLVASSGLTATPGNAQVGLSWTAVTGASSYVVYQGLATGGPYTSAATPSGTTATVTGLTNGTPYYFVVVAVDSGGEGAYSPEATATPVLPPPDAPTGVAAVAGDTLVNLSWNSVSGTTYYKVYRGTTTNGESTTPIATPSDPSYQDTGRTNGTALFYKIKAYGPGGDSAYSAEVTATPTLAAQPPLPPANPSATAGDAQVVLTWTASEGATSYKVYRGVTTGGESGTPLASPVDPTYTDSAVSNGTTYFYKFKATGIGGDSTYSTEVSATPEPLVLDAPTGITATAGNTIIYLAWNDVDGATSYKVFRGTTTGGESGTPIGTPTGSAYADVNRTNGTTYFYTIKAVNAGGDSVASAEVSAAAVANPPIVPQPSGGYLYSHIKTGSVMYMVPNPANMDWLGKHLSVAIVGGVKSSNWTDARSVNPGLELYVYFKVGVNKPSIPGYTTDWNSVEPYLARHPEFNREDAFYHFEIDNAYPNLVPSQEMSRSILSTGYARGLIPGYGQGTAVNLAAARVSGDKWSHQFSTTQYISSGTVSGGNAVISVPALTNTYHHSWLVGDKVQVVGSSSTALNAGGPYTISAKSTNSITVPLGGSATLTAQGNVCDAVTAISRTSGGVTTVTLGTIFTGKYLAGDNVEIRGFVTDTSFNGIFLIETSTPASKQITFTQPDLGALTSAETVGYARQDTCDAFYQNWKQGNDLWTGYTWELYQPQFTDLGGNCANGIFYDALLIQDESSYIRRDRWKEVIEDGAANSVSDWIYDRVDDHLTSVKEAYRPFCEAHGLVPYMCGNSDHVDYAYGTTSNRLRFWNRAAVDISLLEGSFQPTCLASSRVPEYLRAWDSMNTHGRRVIWEAITNTTVKTTDFNGHTIVWTAVPDHADVWVTDAFSENKTPITYVGIGTVNCNYDATATSIGTLRAPASTSGTYINSYVWTDTANGNTYINYPSVRGDPNGINPVMWGIEKFRMGALAQFYVWANCPNSYFYYFDAPGGGNMVYDKEFGSSPITWWEGIGYDVGQPAAGGLKIANRTSGVGTIATDVLGTSCATSSYAYKLYQDPVRAAFTVYARNYSKGLAVMRFTEATASGSAGLDFQSFKMPFSFRQLNTDGTLRDRTDTFSLGTGQGAVLITDDRAPPLPPATPASVLGTMTNGTSVITWDAVTGADSYKVFRGTYAGGESGIALATPTTNTYTDAAVVAGTTYFYTVKAVNSAGDSFSSVEVSVAFPEIPPEIVPVILSTQSTLSATQIFQKAFRSATGSLGTTMSLDQILRAVWDPSRNSIRVSSAEAPMWVKVSLPHSLFHVGSTINSITVYTLPAGGVIHDAKLVLGAGFVAGSPDTFTSYTISIGTAANLDKYLPVFDCHQVASGGTFGFGTGRNSESRLTSTPIRATATSAGANLSASTAGQAYLYLLVSVTN